MVERRVCSFCGGEIEPGTGKMYVKNDGTVYYFCSSKCQKNMLVLKRSPRRVRWTAKYEKTVAHDKETEKKPAAKKKVPLKKALKKEGSEKEKEE